MKIKFWGARGSIPVCGSKYLKYGGSTTCLELRSRKNELMIVDAGSGIRLLGKELLKNPCNDVSMLFTHSHWDHVLGFPFFAPIYNSKTRIRVMGCSFTSDPVREIIAKTMQPPGFPVKFEEISAKFEFGSACASGFEMGRIKIAPIELSHPNRGLGYKFTEGGRSFVFLTDNELGFTHPGGHSPQEYAAFCQGADLLVHDADYTTSQYERRKTWGHSTSAQAVELALKAGVSALGLFHHNQDRSDAEIDRDVAQCRRLLKFRGSRARCFAVSEGQIVNL